MKKSLPLYNTYRFRLSSSELFKDLPNDVLDDMLSHFRFETWHKGSHHDCQLATERFYILLEGRLEITKVNPVTGKQLTLIILSQGDVYDVLSLMDGKVHQVTPIALDDIKLFSAPIAAVREWITKHPEFNKNFMPYLSRRIRSKEALTIDLGLYDTPTRLARLVMRYASQEKDSNKLAESSDIDVTLLHNFSNEALAHMISSARQVVNRHLQAMKKDGILHFKNHHLLVHDLEKLKNQAEQIKL